MNVFLIAWRSIQQRGVASVLTTLSMALGVTLVVAVLSIHGIISESFRGNTTLGYNMIVGARGGKLQMTLNTVFYLSQPIENVPYEYYLAFKDASTRERELKDSIAYHVHETRVAEAQTQTLSLSSSLFGGPASLASLAASDLVQKIDGDALLIDEPGMFANFCDLAIPLCLGDYVGNFRAVGTTPEFFDEIEYDLDAGLKYTFAKGRNFEYFNEENGFFECVVGSVVARQQKIKIGDMVNPLHGAPDGHTHANGFKVVGILNPTGTPNDRAVFVNMEGFYLMSDHSKPVEGDRPAALEETISDEEAMARMRAAEAASKKVQEDVALLRTPLPIEQREVTSILVRSADELGFGVLAMENSINEGRLGSTLSWSKYRPTRAQVSAQAVLPIRQIEGLFMVIVRPIETVLLVLTIMICLVSGISILVSIYNSMSERRHEIAVMRALGAGRGTVMVIILIETVMLALGGGFLGWICGHALNGIASPYIEGQTGVSLGFFDFAPPVEILALFGISGVRISPELALIPALMLLAVIVGLYPSISAYRTDVSKSLGK